MDGRRGSCDSDPAAESRRGLIVWRRALSGAAGEPVFASLVWGETVILVSGPI